MSSAALREMPLFHILYFFCMHSSRLMTYLLQHTSVIFYQTHLVCLGTFRTQFKKCFFRGLHIVVLQKFVNTLGFMDNISTKKYNFVNAFVLDYMIMEIYIHVTVRHASLAAVMLITGLQVSFVMIIGSAHYNCFTAY